MQMIGSGRRFGRDVDVLVESGVLLSTMKKALGPLNWIPPTPSTVKRNGVRKASINTL